MEAMEQIHFEPFELELGGNIGCFGDLFWAGLKQSNHLEKLARQLRHSLAENHIPFDKKKFNPHITMLRKAQFSSHADISCVHVEKAVMTVSEVSLMRSERGKHGMIYTEIGSIVADGG